MNPSFPVWLWPLVDELSQVPGVVGVDLGGSRARGESKPDSDIDVGIFYQKQDFAWEEVARIATQHDDHGQSKGLGSPGEWGLWMNGGAWIRKEGTPVDLLLRDYAFVQQIIEECQRGQFSSHYQIGHPHGWHSYMLMGEVHFNVPLRDPTNKLRALHAQTLAYPKALQEAICNKFLWEARFTGGLLEKLKERDDPYALGGLALRFCSTLVQVLFALHETYYLNEKGALASLRSFVHLPKDSSKRLETWMRGVPDVEGREVWLKSMEALLTETEELCRLVLRDAMRET